MKEPAVRAAGGVLWRSSSDGLEVALVHRPRYDDWSLPKGKADRGEHLLTCAVREVREETGCTVRVGRALGASRYVVLVGGKPARKTVAWWAMEATGGEFLPSREVDELVWLSPARALRRVGRGRGSGALRRLLSGPADTSALVLVPPADAASASSWCGPDATRPLTALGVEEARALVPLIAAYAPARLAAAGPVRCVSTLSPLAAALGTPVDIEPALGREAYDGDPARARRRLQELLAEGTSTAVCVQRQVLAGLLLPLGSGRRPAAAGDRRLWSVAMHAGRVVAVDVLRA